MTDAVADAEPQSARLELYLLRHADAGDPLAWKGDDAERPLSEEGRRQARRVGRWLADLGSRADVIVTSPKVRALETATIIAASLGLKPVIDARLGEPLDHDTLRDLVAERGGDGRRLMLVGHDPDFSSMASSLSGAPVSLSKGALARIDLDVGAGPGSGTLRWLIPPDAIPDRQQPRELASRSTR
jgi:phosphohistidine phosphatase